MPERRNFQNTNSEINQIVDNMIYNRKPFLFFLYYIRKYNLLYTPTIL